MLPLTFSIDNHALTIMSVDGVPHRPHTVSSLDMYPGQRYGVVVEANQPIGNYWIRAEFGRVGVPGHVRNNPNFDPDIRGILHYAGAAENVDPAPEESSQANEFGELDIRDLSAWALPDPRLQGDTPPDIVMNFRFGEDRDEVTGSVEWRINNIAVTHTNSTSTARLQDICRRWPPICCSCVNLVSFADSGSCLAPILPC